MRALLAGLQFLTVCPLGSFQATEDDLSRSVYVFPLIGLILGALAAGLDYCLSWVLPPLPASVLVITAMQAFSGGLHLDGLADTADGFFSSRPRERMLEIMRDSRIGSMGVAALVCVLLLKVSLLASLHGPLRTGMIVLMPLAGRCGLIFMLCLLPYARPDGGLATVFIRRRSPVLLIWSLAFFVSAGYLLAGPAGLPATICSICAALIFTLYTRRKIGGFTGDTLGAACEIAELMPLLAGAVWLFKNLS